MEDYSIRYTTTIREALDIIEKGGKAIAILLDDSGKPARTVTDGDLRRLILSGADLEDPVSGLPARKPNTGTRNMTRVEALALMDEHEIDHLPITDDDGFLVDIYDRRTLSRRIHLSAPHMGELEKGFIEEAFETNWIAPIGPNVDAFEQEMAEMLDVSSAAAFSSGTASIHLALLVLGISEGDTVFCSTLTFVASANPVLYQKAEPVFIDSEPGSWNMSPQALERALVEAKANNRLPKAVIVVNLYGQSADMDPILELADAYGVPVIEDAAESLGAKYKDRASGTFGLLGIYSFNGNKIITTSGGGMLVSNNPDLIEKARFLSTQAREPEIHYEHREIGYNYRMSNILAGVGRGQLRVLDDRIRARRKLFDAYQEAFSGSSHFTWMPEPDWSYSNRWLSVCTINPEASQINARKLIHQLSQEMIEVRPVWKPMHLQPLFAGAAYYPHGNTSISDEIYQTGICLPSGSSMTDDDVQRVTDTIKDKIGSG